MSPSHYSRARDRAVNPSSAGGANTPQIAGNYGSAAYRRMLGEITRLAQSHSAPILLEGESGTGKTLIARRIHAASPRASQPFHSLNVGALDDSLASSELFGHLPGAFTDARNVRSGHFASASGGTLFLDEIGKAGRNVQCKLLHVIETGEMHPVGSDRLVRVDVRVVAASNAPLEALTASGLFLGDLYARLECFRVTVPALRDRRADIPLLVTEAIAAHHQEAGYARPPALSPRLLDACSRAPWPNNLRQLDGTVRRLLLDADGAPEIGLEHCGGCLSYLRELTAGTPDLTDDVIAEAVSRTGRVAIAARELGCDPSTLYRRQRIAAKRGSH